MFILKDEIDVRSILMYVCMYVSASPSPEETTFEDWYAIECVRRTRRDPSNIKYEWTLYLHAEKKSKTEKS